MSEVGVCERHSSVTETNAQQLQRHTFHLQAFLKEKKSVFRKLEIFIMPVCVFFWGGGVKSTS